MPAAITRSIATRLVALFALAALALVMLAGAALYAVLDRELGRHQDDELHTALDNLRYWVERVDTLERWGRVRARMDTLTPADGRLRFWVLSDDPRFLYGKDLSDLERSVGPDGRGVIRLPQQAEPLRTIERHVPALGERAAVKLIVGSDQAPYDRARKALQIALALLSLGAVALALLAGRWIARVGLQPLGRLSREARALRPRATGQRLPVDALPIELSDLAGAFNGAIDRQEAAYRQLEAFNADVAHELRTPLANLIGGTQVALSRPRGAAELQETLQSNLEELERLRSIINDMLFLARADQGEAATALTETCLAREAGKTIEFFEFVLDETGTTVGIEGDLQACAPVDTALFRRALSNLLQNAIEHSARGAKLAVEISRRAGAVWVTVTNPGPGIADEHLPRLFDRFYRVDAARRDTADSGDHRGHGLGLAIVKAVARMHGGSVAAISAGGRTAIGFSVPEGAAGGGAM